MFENVKCSFISYLFAGKLLLRIASGGRKTDKKHTNWATNWILFVLTLQTKQYFFSIAMNYFLMTSIFPWFFLFYIMYHLLRLLNFIIIFFPSPAYFAASSLVLSSSSVYKWGRALGCFWLKFNHFVFFTLFLINFIYVFVFFVKTKFCLKCHRSTSSWISNHDYFMELA